MIELCAQSDGVRSRTRRPVTASQHPPADRLPDLSPPLHDRREGDGEPSGPIRSRWNWSGIGEKREGGRRQRVVGAMSAPAMLIKHQGMMCSCC